MVFVLVLVVFFYGSTEKDPETVHRMYETPEACMAAKSELVAKATANSEVSYAKGICLGFREGEKI